MAINQENSHKRGPKTAPAINGVIDERDKIERVFLEVYLNNGLNVPPTAGLTALARYLHDYVNLKTIHGKPLSVNTIRQELTDILKELKLTNPRGKSRK